MVLSLSAQNNLAVKNDFKKGLKKESMVFQVQQKQSLLLNSKIKDIKFASINFSGSKPKLKIAKNAYNTLSEILIKGERLTHEKHGQLIIDLQNTLGSKPQEFQDIKTGAKKIIDSGLVKTDNDGKVIANIEYLNHPENLSKLVKALKAMIDATDYYKHIKFIRHIRPDKSTHKIAVNNIKIYEYLKEPLNVGNFNKLFKKAEEKGVFSLKFDNGVPSVSDAAGSAQMTRKWTSDHIGMLPLIELKYQEQLLPGLITWAKTYSSPQETKAFEKVIKNPAAYKKNEGIAYVFWHNTKTGELVRDIGNAEHTGWENNQRLEAFGDLLGAFSEKIKNGLEGIDPLGFKKVKDIPDEVVQTIVHMSHYLKAIGPNAQTGGFCEELTFPKGSNCDTKSATQSFKRVRSLVNFIHGPQNTSNPEIIELRKKFIDSEKSLMKKAQLPESKALFNPDTKNLDDYIKEGEDMIRNNYLDEFRESPKRDDAASVIITTSDINLSPTGDFVEDIEKHLSILEKFENTLLGEFGARRYNRFEVEMKGISINSCDSYINKSYDLAIHPETEGIHLPKGEFYDKNFGGSDASEPYKFAARGKHAKEETSAQWALPTSYASIGYGKQVKKLIEKHKKTGTLSKKELKLLNRAFNGETEHIKRTYGNITGTKPDGKPHTKANGEFALVWRKPEAYQTVPTLVPESIKSPNKKYSFVPGVNSHLGWDAAKTFEASLLYVENLKYLEKEKLLKKYSADV